jgi:hypothetical protein
LSSNDPKKSPPPVSAVSNPEIRRNRR